ncbi:SH3 domain-containing protein [Actinomadura napierensis]|uniref:SH3 domain-containing protein n=1 Tax=Actinomadura napierensis TaxID=267854 RepID=A0ABP5LXD0_9ACTN
MRTSARTGTLLAMAGAASGLTLLTGGTAAQAAAPATPHKAAAAKICRYEVIARSGLNVRTGPGTQFRKVPPPLAYGKHIGADCTSTHGWTRLRQSVPAGQIGKWVSRTYLKPIVTGGVCRYEVNARSGLNVRETPNGRLVPPPLPYRKHIGADCTATNGWVRLRQSVPANQVGKWVFRAYLKPITPRSGVMAGGGGTSASTSRDPLLAGAGLGVIALGGGVAIAALRRRAKGLS